MNKDFDMKKIVLILVAIAVVSLIAAFSILVIKGGPMGIHTAQMNKVDEEKSFPVAGLTAIRIATVSTNIQVIPTDSGEIRVHYYGYGATPPELVAVIQGDQLTVRTDYHQKAIRLFELVPSNQQLDLYLPGIYAGKLDVETVSGDLDLPRLNPGMFNFNTVSGDLAAAALYAQSTVLETTSGDIKIRDLQGSLNYRTVSGDIAVASSSLIDDMRISTVSGDVKIGLPVDAGFQFDFSSTSGDFYSNFPIMKGSNRGNKNSYGTTGSGEHGITVNTVSGDLEIVKN